MSTDNDTQMQIDLAFSIEAELGTIPEASSESESRLSQIVLPQIQASILAGFMKFLSANIEFLPEKEVVLDMLSKAIDLAFASIGRPILVNLVKPFVKKQILEIAGNLYDSLLAPPSTQV